jgi:hypothetical protein
MGGGQGREGGREGRREGGREGGREVESGGRGSHIDEILLEHFRTQLDAGTVLLEGVCQSLLLPVFFLGGGWTRAHSDAKEVVLL